jgi:hypothetical protein
VREKLNAQKPKWNLELRRSIKRPHRRAVQIENKKLFLINKRAKKGANAKR